MHLDKAASSPLALVNQGYTDILICNNSAPEPFDLAIEYLMAVRTENNRGKGYKKRNDNSAADTDLNKSDNVSRSWRISSPAPEIPASSSCPDLIKFRGSDVFLQDPKISSYSNFEAADSNRLMISDVNPVNKDSRLIYSGASPVCLNSEFMKGSDKVPESSVPDKVSINGKAEFYIGDDDRSSIREDKADTYHLDRKSSSRSKSNENHTTKPKNQVEPAPQFTTPDGGYGWVVAMSACIVNLFIMGIVRSYGVLYVSIAQRFPESSAYEASWLPVLLSTTGLLLAPVTGILCRKFTSRKVSIAGGLLSFAGLFIGAFARSVMEMILSFGLLTGIGVGLTTTPAVLVTSLYFNKRRALASAICVSGNALGAFIFPPLIELLLNQYGFQGAMIIIAALQLNICAASMLFRPIAVHALVQKKEKSNVMKRERKEKSDNHLAISRDSSLILNSKLTLKSAQDNTDDDKKIHHQVLFLRSSSMINSIPDLTQYARSWNISCKSEFNKLDSHSFACPSSENKLSLISLFVMPSDISSQNGSTIWSSRISDTVSVNSKSFQCNTLTSPCTENNHHSVLYKQCYVMSTLVEMEDAESPINPSSVCENVTSVHETSMQLHLGNSADVESPETIVSSKLEKEEYIAKPNKKSCFLFLCSFFDCSLMKSSTFLLVNLSVFLVGAASPHAAFFLPAYATSLNMDRTAVVSVLCIAAVTDLVGRLGTGFIADRNILDINILYAICVVLGGSGLVLLPLVHSYEGLVFLMSLYGFGVGAWFVMVPTILAKDHGVQRLAATYGLVRMFNGFMNFISPQISGLLIDVTRNYESIYIFMGSCMLAGSVIMMAKFLGSSSVYRSCQRGNGT